MNRKCFVCIQIVHKVTTMELFDGMMNAEKIMLDIIFGL